MTKKQEDLIHERIKQKEKEIDELKDLYFDSKLKRIESEEIPADGTYSSKLYEEDDPSEVIRRCIAYKRESPFSLRNFKKEEPMRKLDGDLSGLLYEPESDFTMVKITENMYAKKKHVCPRVSETTILQVGNSAYFDIHRSMVADEGDKSVRSVRIPLRVCPFCGEKMVYDWRYETEEKEKAIPGIPTNNSVAFEEPVIKLQRYKGRPVNPDSYKVVDGKLYFKESHKGCGGDILVTECGISDWDHGHAQCTKCGKYIGNWISSADGMPFNG